MSDHCKKLALTTWSDKFLEHGRNPPCPAAAEMRHGKERKESWKSSVKNQGQLRKATNRTFFPLKETEVTALKMFQMYGENYATALSSGTWALYQL